jgi:hypothetical protein
MRAEFERANFLLRRGAASLERLALRPHGVSTNAGKPSCVRFVTNCGHSRACRDNSGSPASTTITNITQQSQPS